MAGRRLEGIGGRRNRVLTPHDLAGIISGQGGSGSINPSMFATAAQGAKADSAIQSIVAGTNITIDNTDPHNPIVNASGSGSNNDLLIWFGL